MEPSGSRRVTLSDVARHAGVSTAAASKVLRNAYGVSPAMQSQVRAAMAELGYRPHAAARGMRGQTYTVGILLDSIRNPFFADIMDGVSAELAKTDYQVLVGAGGYDPAQQSRLADAMVDRRMDGLILVAPTMSRAEVVRTARSVPTVVVGHHDSAVEFDTVVDDDITGAGLVVDHLVGLGHRRIAHTTGAPHRTGSWSRTPHQVRGRGYREAMRRHQLSTEISVVTTSFSETGGYQAGRELLARTDPPTAIFAGADIAALGVFRAADELGFRIPEDVSLAGYDNISTAALAPIQLTSVDQPGHQMGVSAARLLAERIAGRTRSILSMASPALVVRGTTGPPPAGQRRAVFGGPGPGGIR